MAQIDFPSGQLILGDCLERMADLPDASVDLILCDLPYGTTQNKWDAVIPFAPLWAQYWRVAKPGAAVVLTAAQPFTSALVMSQVDRFRYDWTWRKDKGTGHLNAKRQPMRDKEDVLVFSNGPPPYRPQMSEGAPFGNKRGRGTGSYGAHGAVNEENAGTRYPRQVLDFPMVGRGTIHPTEKPVPLFEYLIRTYTDEGALVLDNCSGSGTTAIAAINSGRRFLCIERDETYFAKSAARIMAASA